MRPFTGADALELAWGIADAQCVMQGPPGDGVRSARKEWHSLITCLDDAVDGTLDPEQRRAMFAWIDARVAARQRPRLAG